MGKDISKDGPAYREPPYLASPSKKPSSRSASIFIPKSPRKLTLHSVSHHASRSSTYRSPSPAADTTHQERKRYMTAPTPSSRPPPPYHDVSGLFKQVQKPLFLPWIEPDDPEDSSPAPVASQCPSGECLQFLSRLVGLRKRKIPMGWTPLEQGDSLIELSSSLPGEHGCLNRILFTRCESSIRVPGVSVSRVLLGFRAIEGGDKPSRTLQELIQKRGIRSIEIVLELSSRKTIRLPVACAHQVITQIELIYVICVAARALVIAQTANVTSPNYICFEDLYLLRMYQKGGDNNWYCIFGTLVRKKVVDYTITTKSKSKKRRSSRN